MSVRGLWLRPLLARPWRSIVTVLGVAVGVASVVSTILAGRAAVTSLGSDVDVIAGRARLEVRRPGGLPAEDVARLRPLCDELLLVPVVEDVALAPDLDELVRLVGLDLLVDTGARPLELDAPDVEAAREAMLQGRSVALPRVLAQDLGAAPGDELELVVRSRRVRLEVAALFDPRPVSSAWDRVVLADVALAQELFGRLDRVDRVELLPRPGSEASFEAARVTARARALLPEACRVAPASERREEGERLVRALEFNLTALAGVSILVGIVLVATTLATSVVQRREELALLRSLGASRAHLAGALFAEAAGIGVLGAGLGVLGGWLGALAALASVRATVATVVTEATSSGVRMEPRWALLGLALGLFTSLAAVVLPLREVLATPPLQGLRSTAPAPRRPARTRWLFLAGLFGLALVLARLPAPAGLPVWALTSALLLLSTLLVVAAPLIDLVATNRPSLAGRGRWRAAATPLVLAQAALEAGRGRAAWAAGGVGVAVGLAVSMGAMVGSFRATVIDWTEDTMRSDLFVRPVRTAAGSSAGVIDPEVTRVVAGVVGRDRIDPFHSAPAWLGESRVELAGAAFDVAAREGGLRFLDGRPAREAFREALERGTALVNEPFARRFDAWPGDVVELRVPTGTLRREIGGVYRDYSGQNGRIVVDLEDFLALYPGEGPRSIAVYLADEASPGAVRTAIAAALGETFAVEILNNREVRAEVLAVFERTFAVTVALQVVASVVAGIAVVTVLLALIHERRRELAIVRALGASRLQLVGMVTSQALLLGLAGALGGLVVGCLVGYVLVTVVNLQSFGWTLRFAPPASVIWTVVAVVPACLAAGLVPALLALRTAPREALREAA